MTGTFNPDMIAQVQLHTPVDRELLAELHAGEEITLSGDILVFRDQVHRRLVEMLDAGEELPFSLRDQALYYCGPTPARQGMPVGSAGPTTSSRMDAWTGRLLELGLAITIGKGNRSPEVVEQMRRYRAVYLAAVGGAGALLAQHVIDSCIIAFPEYGPEAARKFTVKEMPLIVAIDTNGETSYVE